MFNEKSIISKWIADMYDQNETDVDDVNFLLSVIGQTPKRILEVCCGSGRILVPLAKAGHIVTGFDADEFMLAKILSKAEGLGYIEHIEWKIADAVNSEWGAGYDVVVLAGNIMYNIVSDIDNAKAQELFIHKAASALAAGGHVYIEYQPGGHRLMQPEAVPSTSSDCVIWKGTDSDGNYGRMTLINGEYDSDTRLDSFIRRFEITLKNGETITQDIHCVKHFATIEQIHGWLSDAGFTDWQEYGDYSRNSVNNNSNRVIIYARKG